jgi:hypothetical protein
MPEYNIKISELNIVSPQPPFTEDFFPLVHSASMTTYRTTIQDIGSLMTHSIFADTCSFADSAKSASHADYADSASYAISSSYALSASHALIADSASFYPPVNAVISCSYASHSHDSDYATRSIDVDTRGNKYFYPHWNTENAPGINGALNNRNVLYFSQSSYGPTVGPVVVDPDVTFQNMPFVVPDPIQRPDFSQSGWWNITNLSFPTDTYYQGGTLGDRGYHGGMFSPWPIVSATFSGTDQKAWTYSTTSIHGGLTAIWSGSSANGSFATLNTSFNNTFNGKWMRIAVTNTGPDWSQSLNIPSNIAKGESPGSFRHTGMFGRVRIVILTTNLYGGSNKYQSIDFSLQNYYWNDEIQAVVHHASNVGVVKAIRFSKTTNENGSGGYITDPFQTMDVLLNDFWSSDYEISILFQSWGGIRFLNYPNLDPPVLVDTGSANIHSSQQLIIPPRPGFYSSRYVDSGNDTTYNIFGKHVIIDPSANEITASGGMAQYSMSLNVSGSIHATEKYYANNQPGLTTTAVYGTNVLTFVGGILVGKNPP